MNEKPVIIVTGKVPNMQSWYEEKCKRTLEVLSNAQGIPTTEAGRPKKKKLKRTCSTPCAWC